MECKRVVGFLEESDALTTPIVCVGMSSRANLCINPVVWRLFLAWGRAEDRGEGEIQTQLFIHRARP